MSSTATAEQLLISALLNTHDVFAAQTYGLTADFIQGYPAEYHWLLNYLKTYGEQPDELAFRQAFPAFELNSHTNVRGAVDAVFAAHARRRMTAAMSEAYEALDFGDRFLAWECLQAGKPLRTAPKPRELLTDLSFLDSWDEPLNAVEMPYPSLQSRTGGIRPGNLWYVGARPKQGKSSHLINMAQHAVLAGNRVRFFSLEMSEEEVRARFHASLATHYGYRGITLDRLRERTVERGVLKGFLGELADRLQATGGHLEVLTPADVSMAPSTVAAGASEAHLQVVDYVQLMKADDGARGVDDWRIAAKISNTLKEIALSAKTGILAAAQINREGEHGYLPPKLKNLSQSDALGQDADVILTLRSCEYDVATAFSVEGNRHGPSGGKFWTTFRPNLGTFTEISGDTVEALVVEQEAAR